MIEGAHLHIASFQMTYLSLQVLLVSFIYIYINRLSDLGEKQIHLMLVCLRRKI